MVVSMMAGLAGTAGAQTTAVAYPNFLTGDFNECYFTAVSNGEDFGLGASQTSVTAQNISGEDGFIFIWRGNGNGWTGATYAQLNAGASKTFTGADLGIPAGTVAPVVIASYDGVSSTAGAYLEFDPLALACVAKQAVAGNNLPFTSAADTSVSGYNAVSGREVGFADELYLPIAQTNSGPGGQWNSIIRVANVGFFANAAVTVRFFPATEYAAGSLQSGFQLQALVNIGETWSIDLASLLQPGEEWVGAVHVYSDDEVVGMVDRYKAGTDMWITNTASNYTAESNFQPGFPYVLFAPDVRTDYNGWNTGISVANLEWFDTDVSIQYFGSGGNAPLAKSARLSAHGMTFFYDASSPSEDRCQQPATQVPGCEYIGGAIILSTSPVAAVVDGVKYFGNDANVGQAFSYSATGNAYDLLAAPLVQRGNPTTGFGATSGINFMNTNAAATVVTTHWINPSGFLATNFAPSTVWVPGFSTGFVYTMFHHNLPAGFVGSAVVESDLPITATTANVDYMVDGDGTAIWNLYNPCGLFRQAGECVWESPLEPLPVTASITKEVICQDCDLDFDGVFEDTAVAGANVSAEGVDGNGFGWTSFGYTNDLGQVVLVVPAGTYDIYINTLPEGLVGTGFGETVTVAEGESITVTNYVSQADLEGEGILTKYIVGIGPLLGAIPGSPVAFRSEVIFCDADMIGLDWTGEEVADSGLCDSQNDDAWVASGGVDNYFNDINSLLAFTTTVDAGRYYICSSAEITYPIEYYDEELDEVFTDFETIGYEYMCDEWVYVFDGEETTVYNDFSELAVGALDVYVTWDELLVNGFDVNALQIGPDGAVLVCLRDGDTNEVIDCEWLDGTFIDESYYPGGWVTFYVPAGNYVVTATDYAGVAETQDASIDYNLLVDYLICGYIWDGYWESFGVDGLGDPGCADVRINLEATP